MTPYEILGVAVDASTAAIKAAFRSLAQKHHPDKGGRKELMQEIQAAYDLLSDPERRRLYDETGDTRPAKDPRTKALSELSNLVASVLASLADKDVAHADPIQEARDALNAQIEKGEHAQRQVTKLITQRQKVIERLIWRQRNPENILLDILNAQIVEAHGLMEQNEQQILKWRQVLDLLADFDYRTDPAPPTPVPDDLQRLFAEHLAQSFRGRFGV